MADKKNINIDSTFKALVDTFTEMKLVAQENFQRYTKMVYESKVHHHFPYLLAPVVQGGIIKINNTSSVIDSQAIELKQKVTLIENDNEVTLYTLTNGVIFPVDCVYTSLMKDYLILGFMRHDKAVFEIRSGFIDVWFCPQMCSADREVYIFEQFSKNVKVKISDQDGNISVIDSFIEYGNTYTQHVYQRIGNDLNDPRLQFRMRVNLKGFLFSKFNSIEVHMPIKACDVSLVELEGAFHTNLFPVGNHMVGKSDPFVMDGTQDIYWLSMKHAAINVFDVMCVYVDNIILSPSDYTVIYRGGKAGLEFNNISAVLNKEIYAVVNFAVPLPNTLYAMSNYYTLICRWPDRNISNYDLCFHALLKENRNTLNSNDIRTIVNILTCIKNQSQIRIDVWLSLIRFFDCYASIPVTDWLEEVVYKGKHDIDMIFNMPDNSKQSWVKYYIKRLESFLYQSVGHNLFKIQVIF